MRHPILAVVAQLVEDQRVRLVAEAPVDHQHDDLQRIEVHRVAVALREDGAQGFVSLGTGTAPKAKLPVTQIRYGTNSADAAKTLLDSLLMRVERKRPKDHNELRSSSS